MGQLRDKIRTMVREEFVSKMLEEAKKKPGAAQRAWGAGKSKPKAGGAGGAAATKTTKGGESVYRHSNYPAIWDKMEKGKPTTSVTPNPTKFDFVRRVMKMINKADSARTTEAIYLEPEHKAEALRLLSPFVNDPDKFIDTLNKERGRVFGQAYEADRATPGQVLGGKLRSSPDPVNDILQSYVDDKDVLKSLSSVEADAPPGTVHKDEEDHEGEENTDGEYDIIPGATSKADIARALTSDPTETTTEMSVGNRLKKAMAHLSKDRNLEILEFIKDPTVDSADKKAIVSDLDRITSLAKQGLNRYSDMFVDSMIEAFRAVKNVSDDAEVDKAVKLGRNRFVKKLGEAGTFSKTVNKESINPYEFNVFTAALDRSGGRWTVLDMLLIAAKKPDKAAMFRDEAVASVKETFRIEADKQTNFNSLGDFTDAMPEVKQTRDNLFKTLEKRGRKPGSTKEVLAAKKVAAGKAAAAAAPKRRGRPPKAR